MPHAQIDRPYFHAPQEPDAIQYRAISGLAAGALALGLIAPIAFAAPALWVVPILGVASSVLALRRVASYAPALLGRKAALAGLALSVLFGVAAPTSWLVYRWELRNEARRFGAFWFDFLLKNEPHKALQLTENHQLRQPLDDSLWEFYPKGSESRTRLEQFLHDKTVRTLLALGDKAIVRYYDTERHGKDIGRDTVLQTYAVTFQSEGEPTTFFVALEMDRFPVPATGRAYWRVANVSAGIKPVALGGSGKRGLDD